ncbi:acyl carrier protein [Actinokineospora baliensis]|uniref:hypothetical protein n=1 Tax=Actinokineospora baliensis TaxID=547056 RepID=UPI00195A3482|nr:hypothetical protein [Actinokineospora baliensis]MBM7774773.1 acyl carrier protein [Actinokineospora baliensis]
MTADPTQDEIRERVRTLASALLGTAVTADQDEVGLADIGPDRYDSLGVLDCVATVEREFEVQVDLVDDDLRTTFRSVASISALVGHKLTDARALEWR